jgi:hypothetical protein
VESKGAAPGLFLPATRAGNTEGVIQLTFARFYRTAASAWKVKARCKLKRIRQYGVRTAPRMDDSSRFRLAAEPLDDAPPEASTRESSRVRRESGPTFVGDAMRQLFESADVTIARGHQRGDETRVLNKDHEEGVTDAMKAVEQERQARSRSEPPPSVSSVPPGPRVDVALWVVLALGLFAIAGGMIVYAL